MADNLVFHLLDIQTRDGYITSENKTSKEVVYESDEGEGDAEFRPGRRGFKKSYVRGRREYTVHLFGSTATGQTVRVDVTGFRPYFYVRLPFEGSQLEAKRALQNYIEGQLNSKHNVGDEFTYKIVHRKDFMGFTARKEFAFLRIEVPSIAAFRDCRGIFLDSNNCPQTRVPLAGPWKGRAPAVYEANLDPMLRFIHDTGIKPCEWVGIKEEADSLDGAEIGELLVIDADMASIYPAASPGGIPTAPFLKAFWDIECYSETGDFPVAKRTWNKTAKDIIWARRDGKLRSAADIHDEIVKATRGESAVIGHILCEPISMKSQAVLNRIAENTKNFETIWSQADCNFADAEQAKTAISEELEAIYSVPKAVALKGDPVIQIGTILTRGTAETTERHLFTWKDCAAIEGAVVHAYEDEETMIDAWFAWLVKSNPDELVGYNVFGFDERYLWERCEEKRLTGSDCIVHEMSRLADQGNAVKLGENRLSSSALGDNFLYTWTTPGRLQVDLYFYVKRSGASLASYKLDDVAKHYMSGKVKTVQMAGDEIVLACSGAVRDVRPGRSLQLMDDIGESVCDKIRVLRVDLKDSKSGTIVCSAVDLTEDERETIGDGTKWAIVKDDVSPQEIFRLWRGTAEDRARIGGYCVQDCELVMELYRKLEVFNNSMSMANVCLVPISYIFMRGQGVKIESLIFRDCAVDGTLVPVLENPPQIADGVPEESYEGAIVLDPEPGLYKDSPVGVCDFASLYPSTIISENISHDMLVWVRDYTDNGDLIEHVWGSDEYAECDGYAYTDIEFDLLKPDPTDRRKNPAKIRCGRRICRYAEPLDGTKGLLPEIIKKLLAARKAKRKEAEREENPERKNLLDAEQLAYKVTANSLYGQLGSKTFKIRLLYLAASVTAYARKQLLFSKECIEVFYGPGAGDPRCAVKAEAKIVYGDSVTGDTFVQVMVYGNQKRIPIKNLANEEPGGKWLPCRNDDKECYELQNVFSWTDSGWTRVHRIIRHKLPEGKKIYRVRTLEGYIDVTDDHSLLDSDGLIVKPTELSSRVLARLLSTKYPKGDIFCGISELSNLPASSIMVYDLTTDNHHFQAGPEGLIVHNTDSIFAEINPRNPETGERLQGRDARQASIDLTGEMGHFITQALRAPHDFEFDKIFDPLLMFSKKRYAGKMYESNADEFVYKYMGIALKRRDNAPIVKTIFGGAMRELLDRNDVAGGAELVMKLCDDLVEGRTSLGQLTITKSLRAEYANASGVAHKVLADRMAARDPGTAPAAGDRIPYIYIQPKPGQVMAKLQGDRIETPGWVRAHSLKPDYAFYITNQIQNPVCEMFAIVIREMPGYTAQHEALLSRIENTEMRLVRAAEIAAEILLGPALAKCSNAAKRAFGEKLLGIVSGVSTTAQSPDSVASRTRLSMAKKKGDGVVTATKPQQQQTLQNFFTTVTMDPYLADSMMIKKIESKISAKKKAESPENKVVIKKKTKTSPI